MLFKPGSLIEVRSRKWIVLPSPKQDILYLKPLGGSEDEVTGIYLPLCFKEDQLKTTEFAPPTPDDIGDLSSARILYNASRISFRSVAGPFRSIGKLSFRPRSYQMVPLIMALKQPGPIRLLIADDVGVGKTVEALLVLKEFIERREIKRFAVIALPHLCDQWQTELRDKFGIDAVIIRSNTQARLDREITGDTSVFMYYPYQIISIDYIKTEQRREVFIQECPELIIVDEAHTCSVASDSRKTQQLRYFLIKRISKKTNQHLILLTATPHSGKREQFNSLLSLINEKYQSIDLPTADRDERKELAEYYVQRRRADVEKWMNERSPFPTRQSGEYSYELSNDYLMLYQDILDFVSGLMKIDCERVSQKRFRYWSVLSLLRGVMSSPAAGIAMLHNRLSSKADQSDEYLTDDNPVMDQDYGQEVDNSPTELTEVADYSNYEKTKLREFAKRLSGFCNFKQDRKVQRTLEIIKQWLAEKSNPVIFCRFIATANYLGEILFPELKKVDPEIDCQVITSEDPDDVRKERINGMMKSVKRVLIATDCLSEGINLQDYFNAVLHYDLPWNPNRLEQREGRVDRFGQKSEEVKAFLLYGKDNPIDGVVLRVLLRKVREIRQSTGISIPFPEDSQSLIDAILQAVLLSPRQDIQMTLDFEEEFDYRKKELSVTDEYEKAAEREKLSRSIFAQHAIKDNEIEEDLKQTDAAIGNPNDVEDFVKSALSNLLGVQISATKKGYILYLANLPNVLKSILPNVNQIKISFHSPSPEGYTYLGRNHPFVEQLCQYLLANSLEHKLKKGPARAAVIVTNNVVIKTTILLFRVRNVIEDKDTGNQMIAEEMLTWGYRGTASDGDIISKEESERMLREAVPTADLSKEARADFLRNEISQIALIKNKLNEVAQQRAETLVESHERFRKAVGGNRYKTVKPVLPMDLMGIYILLPNN